MPVNTILARDLASVPNNITGCDQCGALASGTPSCCGFGGSWRFTCGTVAQVAAKSKSRTWVQGIEACQGKMSPEFILLPRAFLSLFISNNESLRSRISSWEWWPGLRKQTSAAQWRRDDPYTGCRHCRICQHYIPRWRCFSHWICLSSDIFECYRVRRQTDDSVSNNFFNIHSLTAFFSHVLGSQ